MESERSVLLSSDKIALSCQVHSGVSFPSFLGISTVYFTSKIINTTLRRDSLASWAVSKDNANCDTSWKETVLIT